MLKSGHLFFSKQLRTILRTSFINKNSYCTVKWQMKVLATQLSIRDDLLRCNNRLFHISCIKLISRKDDVVEAFDNEKSLLYSREFDKWEEKNKKSYLETIRTYKQNVKNRAGHVDFIKAALRSMKEYGVHKDLECYKKLIDVLPKGVYVCTNKFMADGMYYPRQQYVTLDLLDQMGSNGVIPDVELGIILRNIFGKHAQPVQKYKKMFYWMAMKWKNQSPFPLPRPLPNDPLSLAKLAIERITSVDLQTKISVFQTTDIKESVDKTWIVSAQSPKQQKLLQKHPKDIPVIVEGGDLVWLLDKSINYFILKADGEPLPFFPPGDLDDVSNLKSKFFNPDYAVEERKKYSVHEQDDGIIYAVCATGTSSKDSLLSWVRTLQKTGNPILEDVPVLFRFKQKESLPAPITEEIVTLQK